jgi:hypothetical protein
MLSVILVLLIAAQPVQAGFCAMEPPDGAPQNMGGQHMDMGHMGAPHAGMRHASMQSGMQSGMQADAAPDTARHDCCAAADPESGPACDTLDQCGSCMAGTAAVPALATPFAAPTFGYRATMGADQITPSHALPPFRPPTTVS